MQTNFRKQEVRSKSESGEKLFRRGYAPVWVPVRPLLRVERFWGGCSGGPVVGEAPSPCLRFKVLLASEGVFVAAPVDTEGDDVVTDVAAEPDG